MDPELLPPIEAPVAELLNQHATHLEDVLSMGAQGLRWAAKVDGQDDYVVPLFMYRHALELLGAIAAQIRASWVEPADITVRAMLETALSLEYLLVEDKVRRGYAYLVWDAHRDLKTIERLDPSTQMGKQFKADIAKDKLLSESDISMPFDSKARIAEIRELLQQPGYAEAELEYQRLLRAKPKNKSPEWYTLFSEGITNIEHLARKLKRTSFYEMYRSLSRTAHANNVVRGKLSSGKDGKAEILQLRWPEGVRATTMLAGTFGVHCIRVLVEAVVPDRRPEVLAWYGRIRERHLNLPDIVREA
jgi:hypothetical protein